MNAIMFPIFLGDFLYRFFTAESRAHYFFRSFGWADLLSSLPFQQVKSSRSRKSSRLLTLIPPKQSWHTPYGCSKRKNSPSPT